MITISRAQARQFRSVLRRSLQDLGHRSAWPLLRCRSDSQGVTLEAQCGELAMRYQISEPQPPETLVFRSSLLAQLEGRSETKIELERLKATKGCARFDDGGVPQSIDFDLEKEGSVPKWPLMPKQLASLPSDFLTAMLEAARTCATDAGRFALTCIQLRGKQGEVIATDGKQLLVQRGFPLPWSDDVLVPHLSVLGSREVFTEDAVAVGRTHERVFIQAGPWTFALTIATNSRFPDVDVVIPKLTSTITCLRVDESDAVQLINVLAKLPGAEETYAPVTLDLDQVTVVRAKRNEQGAVVEAALPKSTRTGPAMRLCVNRTLLWRALKLGLREFHFPDPDKPFVARDDRRLYVILALSKSGVIPPSKKAVSVTSEPTRATVPAPIERKTEIMPAPPNQPSMNGNGSTPRYGLNEVIEDVEQLRTLFQDAGVRVTRVLGALKQQKRQTRAVKQAVDSLKQLRFGT